MLTTDRALANAEAIFKKNDATPTPPEEPAPDVPSQSRRRIVRSAPPRESEADPADAWQGRDEPRKASDVLRLLRRNAAPRVEVAPEQPEPAAPAPVAASMIPVAPRRPRPLSRLEWSGALRPVPPMVRVVPQPPSVAESDSTPRPVTEPGAPPFQPAEAQEASRPAAERAESPRPLAQTGTPAWRLDVEIRSGTGSIDGVVLVLRGPDPATALQGSIGQVRAWLEARHPGAEWRMSAIELLPPVLG